MSEHRWEHYLELAREVQLSLLPEDCPDVKDYQFFDSFRPGPQVSGDYYDYLRLPNDRIAIIVADIVGRGVETVLLMAKFSADARRSLTSAASPGQALSELNNRLSRLRLDRFVTAVFAVLDIANHSVSVANAGHCSPILRTANGTVSEPGNDNAGLPLGIMAGFDYTTTSVTMGRGDTMALYTDGVIEAIGSASEFYSMDRLKKAIAAARPSVRGVGEAVETDARHFAASPLDDDWSLVVFGRQNTPSSTNT